MSEEQEPQKNTTAADSRRPLNEKEKRIAGSSGEAYENSLRLIRGFLTKGRKQLYTEGGAGTGQRYSLYSAAEILCGRLGLPIAEIGAVRNACGPEFTLEDIARISHFPCRRICMGDGWQHRDIGDFIAFREKENGETEPVVCMNSRSGRYSVSDGSDPEHSHPLGEEEVSELSEQAYIFYRTFPQERMGLRSLIRFGAGSFRHQDLFLFLLLGALMTLIGMMLPPLTQLIYDVYIGMGESLAVVQLCLVLLACNMAGLLFGIVRNGAFGRLGSSVKYAVQAAVYDRLFNMPEEPLRRFDAADIAGRASGIGELIEGLFGTVAGAVFSVVLGTGYAVLMFFYSWKLALCGLGLLAAAVLLMIPFLGVQRRVMGQAAEQRGSQASLSYQMIAGVARIKLFGAETRVCLRYLEGSVRLRSAESRSRRITQHIASIQAVFTALITGSFYFLTVQQADLTMGEYLGLVSAYGLFSGAVFGLITAFTEVCGILPGYERARPILETSPDYNPDGRILEHLEGDLEVSHLSFSYRPEEPDVLDDLSFRARPGEYIGIAGSSGCGKSTLMRLLLGLETPRLGRIYFDGTDSAKLDRRELRKKLGVVLQNEQVFSGTIFENLTVTCPGATEADAWEALRLVDMERDVKAMPMGLYTRLSEGGGGISGGQQQRILIARAIMGHPGMLFLDEATSALDNAAQKAVCDSLKALRVTRIVVAHRLSTIRDCDRILVLDKGRIAEQGTYEELMAHRGLFYRMSMHQVTGSAVRRE